MLFDDLLTHFISVRRLLYQRPAEAPGDGGAVADVLSGRGSPVLTVLKAAPSSLRVIAEIDEIDIWRVASLVSLGSREIARLFRIIRILVDRGQTCSRFTCSSQ